MLSVVEKMDKSADQVDRIDVEAVNSRENRSLYKAREKIFPKRAFGTFRTLKWWVMLVTLSIYYITPWLRWDRGHTAPYQAVLVDLANGRFYFFSIEIWPQEFYYVAGLLIMAGIGLFLVTSSVGRAWCGYTCPQTVWVDLFLVVERWIEGDRNARIKLDKARLSIDKFLKRLSKHTIWLLIAVATGGAWIFYFADAPTLAWNFITFNAPPVAYYTVAILTATTYVFGGLLREQVCTYMCPWPRIQAAMLDEDSLVVTYNDYRGEPRSRHRKKTEDEQPAGDCVDCNLCVAVCPVGIDIRKGQQLECITCALCIDACNSVMDKVSKPRGLISYSTLKEYNKAKAGIPSEISLRSFIRPRTIIYSLLWSCIGLVMIYMLITRQHLDINVLHDRNPIYVKLSDGSIRNGYTIKILNMDLRARSFILRAEKLPDSKLFLSGSTRHSSDGIKINVDPDAVREVKIYVIQNKSNQNRERQLFRFKVKEVGGLETSYYDAVFNGPKK